MTRIVYERSRLLENLPASSTFPSIPGAPLELYLLEYTACAKPPEEIVYVPEIVSLNPFRCRMWSMHDRIEGYVSEETCRAEIESFERHGQLVPALGRSLRNDPDHDVELIYGARRLFVARYINKPLLVELRNLSDHEAIVAMHIENRHRSDISPYERGLSYARWLRAGYFQSQEDIARAINASCSQVSRLLKLARLPTVIVGAFASPQDIREGWGLSLMDALDDPNRREATVRKARAIAATSRRPSPGEIYAALLSASAPGRKPKLRTRDTVIKDSNGAPLFRLKHQRRSVAFVLPREKMSLECLENVCGAVATVLQNTPNDRVAQAMNPGSNCEASSERSGSADSRSELGTSGIYSRLESRRDHDHDVQAP